MPNPTTAPLYAPRHQAGVALVISLVFLVLLTLLGLTAMGVSGLEERMSGNTRDRILAFNAAEASLRDCETILQGAALPPFSGVTGASSVTTAPSTPGLYQPASADNPPVWDIVTWTSASHVRVNAEIPQGASSAPRCIIEEMPPIPGSGGGSLKAGLPLPDTGIFRITARGVGRNSSTVIMVQSTYVR